MEASISADVATARDTVDEVTGLRRRTRQAYWFPLVAFGVLVLGAAPFYDWGSPGGGSPGGDGLVFYSRGADAFPGLFAPGRLGLYWVIGIAVAYLVCAGFYLWRTRRRGVGTPPLAYLLVGIGLIALLALVTSTVGNGAVVSWYESFVPPDLVFRGLMPLMVIALGFVVLAVVERSAALGIFAVAFLGLTVLVNLYDMANLTDRVGLYGGGASLNVVVPGLALVVAGIVALAAERPSGRRP